MIFKKSSSGLKVLFKSSIKALYLKSYSRSLKYFVLFNLLIDRDFHDCGYYSADDGVLLLTFCVHRL